jgi:surface polysaccharide O-acyltransferase-like enzyme
MKKLVLQILFFFITTFAFAQEKVEMADVMRSNGKIYTVVAVCLTILIGLIGYAIHLDRKISKLEKNQQQ